MNKEKLSKIFSVVVGIVFLFSGIGKMIDVTGFAFLINSYGLGWAVNLAPLIVIIEIATGILLIFGIQLRIVSLFTILILVTFTIAYGYGYWVHGIEDCGCFGAISKAKTPFWIVLMRNIFLIYLMVETCRRTTFELVVIKWKPSVIVIVIFVSTFISGLTFYPIRISSPSNTEHKLTDKPISAVSAQLNELLSSDSSYLVFAFTYTCPHCWNSIENLKQYENLSEIDRVIGITLTDTTNSNLFREQFNPHFSIYAMPSAIMDTLVNAYPTIFYVKEGYIRQVIVGELPCSYFFRKIIQSKLNQKKKKINNN